MKTSVLRNRLVVEQSKIFPGSETNVKKFRSNQACHVEKLQKSENKTDFEKYGDRQLFREQMCCTDGRKI